LPAHIPLDRFKRVLVTAVNTNPDLLFADRRTLYNASVKCAADGLLPDGRDAALVIHNTKIKLRNPAGLDEEFRVEAVTYMPMIAGIRRRMQNSGEVLSAEAEVVCANDKFAYQLGDNPFIEHAPPALTEERGDVIGAYAIIRLRSGEVIRDVMRRDRIEQARKQSRSPNSLMWEKFYEEGARKTVLRHASKQVPQSADIDRLLDRDDEPSVIEDMPGLPAPALQRVEPEPPPPPIEIQQDNEPSYAVMTLDGEEVVLKTAGAAAKALTLIFAEAARQGVKQLEGAMDSNLVALSELEQADENLAKEVYEDFDGRMSAAKQAEARKADTPPPTPPASATPPPAAPAASAPAATSTTAPAGLSATGDAAAEVVEDGTSQSWLYEPVLRNGKYDWRAWALGIFIPRIRRDVQDSTDFALCLADNEENLKRARLALHESDRHTLEQAIEQQWQTLGNG
jgi:recombination protein RecT